MTPSPLKWVLRAHYLHGCISADSGVVPLCDCGANLGQAPTHAVGWDRWVDHVLALVATETRAELVRQFSGSGSLNVLWDPDGRVYL